MKRDTAFNELFIGVIRGLYLDQTITVDDFKDRNAELLKNKWIDTRHGTAGEKIYELFDENTEGEIVKESLQEWLCDNRQQITNCISITLRNHERSYAEWFRYIEYRSGPDELALYGLSRKYGIHTAVFNRSYVWTTLSEHIHRSDEEIYSLCGVNLVFLGETTYGIIRKIRMPQIPASVSTSSKPTRTPSTGKNGKTTCRSNIKPSQQTTTRGRGRGSTCGKTAHTLSESRKANYGINTDSSNILNTKHSRAQIDYLALNDGLEEDTKPSPKRKKRVTHRPKGGPSNARIAAQKSMRSPESECRSPLPSPTPRTTLPGVPTENTASHTLTVTSDKQKDELSGVSDINSNPAPTIAVEIPLTGVPTSTNRQIEDDALPDLVLNSGTANNDNLSKALVEVPELQQDLEAASVLLSLHDEVRDDTLDEAEEDENALLMPIGGAGAAVDVAPQEILLDQPNVDAAIAEIVQNELNTEDTNVPPDQHSEQTNQTEQNIETMPTQATASQPKEDTQEKEPKKGSLRMKGYGLKRKQTSNRTFKCVQCDSVKSSIKKLNAHFKRRHPPQMCGICGRTFTLAASLSRHMYDHQELKYKCEHCSEAFHFESELTSHKIKHRNKNVPSFQCMKTKCGKWFMRKWDLTLHLQKHDKEKHYCDYEGCEFWTNTSKSLNEHKKSHRDDCTHTCKECGKGFKYRSGLKRHRDKDHKPN